MAVNAVILNDTRGHHHFGCHRVMRIIEKNLIERGINILASSLVRRKWWEDRDFLSAAARADLVVINGEGTFHHGSRHAEALLKAADHPAINGKPLVLMNALYQSNPSEWRRYLEKFSLVYARDSKSAEELSHILGRSIPYMPDLSMAEGVRNGNCNSREFISVGESVLPGATDVFIGVAREYRDVKFIPIVSSLKSSKPQYNGISYWLREAYINFHTAILKIQLSNAIVSTDEYEYEKNILRSKLHITGRFHAACFCISNLIPFAALSSNSWKIESMLNDMGADGKRLIEIGQIRDAIYSPEHFLYSESELKRVKESLEKGRTRIQEMFDDIAKCTFMNRS